MVQKHTHPEHSRWTFRLLEFNPYTKEYILYMNFRAKTAETEFLATLKPYHSIHYASNQVQSYPFNPVFLYDPISIYDFERPKHLTIEECKKVLPTAYLDLPTVLEFNSYLRWVFLTFHEKDYDFMSHYIRIKEADPFGLSSLLYSYILNKMAELSSYEHFPLRFLSEFVHTFIGETIPYSSYIPSLDKALALLEKQGWIYKTNRRTFLSSHSYMYFSERNK